MRRAISILAGAMVLGGAAQASATQAEVWQGTAFVSSVTSQCTTSGGASIGDFYTLVYRPIIAGTQKGPEGLAFFAGRGTVYYYTNTAASSFRTAGIADQVAITPTANMFSTATGSAAAPYALKIASSAAGSTPSAMTITGTIDNFWTVSGCNVGISAALVLGVD